VVVGVEVRDLRCELPLPFRIHQGSEAGQGFLEVLAPPAEVSRKTSSWNKRNFSAIAYFGQEDPEELLFFSNAGEIHS